MNFLYWLNEKFFAECYIIGTYGWTLSDEPLKKLARTHVEFT